MDDLRKHILNTAVRRAGAGVTLVSPHGKPQDWLLDLRPIFLHRDLITRIARAFWARYGDREPFQLAAVETAAIPLLTALILLAPQERGRVNGLIMRKERKTSGLGNAIEGSILTDQPIVLVDDVLNSGASAEKARVVLQAHDQALRECFIVVDFKSPQGVAWRATHGIDVQHLFTLEDLGLELKSRAATPMQRYRKLWHTAVPGGYPYFVVPKSTPLLDGDRLYRGCDSGKMQAFCAQSGTLIWEYAATGATSRKGIWSSPCMHEGRIFFGAYNGTAYCLDAASGQEIWSRSYGEWIGASPLIVPEHGLVCIGIEHERPWARGSLAALDIDTGSKVWEHQIAKFQHGSPAYWRGGDLIIWGTADHEMVAFDADSGSPEWVFPTRRSVKYAPAVDEDRELVAFASFDKCIYVLDAASGIQRGVWETGEICYTTPLFCGDKLFCGSGDRHLYVIDLNEMKLLRKIDLGARVYSSPRQVSSRVVVGTNGGRVVEMDTESLAITGSLQLPDAVTNAVVASPDGRRLFISTYMNDLYAFERVDAPGSAPPG